MMRYVLYGLAMALTVTIANPAWAQTDQPEGERPAAQPAGTPPASAQGAADRVSVVEQDVWIVFAEEPSQHFHRARADFWKDDMVGAATEILKGAAFLKLAADTAGGGVKDALMASVRQLDLLAYNVQMGGTVYITDFDRRFAQAEAALADYFLRRTREAWKKKDAENTGVNLRIATLTLENAWGWTGERPASDTIAVIKRTHELSSQLVGGAGWTDEQVTVEVDRIGSQIEKLKKKTAAAKKV